MAFSRKHCESSTWHMHNCGSNGSASRTPEIGAAWDDYAEYHFRCLHCDEKFWLHAETYHGSGGYCWRRRAGIPTELRAEWGLGCRGTAGPTPEMCDAIENSLGTRLRPKIVGGSQLVSASRSAIAGPHPAPSHSHGCRDHRCRRWRVNADR